MSAGAVSAQLQGVAETLAAQIETGAFDALSPAERCDLRKLPMALAGMADRVATLEREQDGLWAVIEGQRRVFHDTLCRARRAFGVVSCVTLALLLWAVI